MPIVCLFKGKRIYALTCVMGNFLIDQILPKYQGHRVRQFRLIVYARNGRLYVGVRVYEWLKIAILRD